MERSVPSIRRMAWGLAITALSAGCIWAASFVATDRFQDADGTRLLLVFGMAEPWIAFTLFLLGGPAAITALTLLVPPLVRLVKTRWARRVLGSLVVAASAAAGLVWLLLLFVFLLGAGARDYLTVRAADGLKVIVSQDNFDGDTVSIWVPHSALFYRATDAGQELSGSEAVMQGDCGLDSSGNGLVLTCGTTTVPIERTGE